MNILVTGVAGFIGSSLAARFLKEGHRVRGIDCLTENYSLKTKRQNLKSLLVHPSFSYCEEDLLTSPLPALFSGIDACYHQAAQPGVRSSWGANFDSYVRNNILVTQRLLEYMKQNPLKKFVYASTSSVYGDCPLPMHEGQLLRPVSPYGVTKLAAENLLNLYSKNYGLSYTSFRYFTVYGPRQRPDMAFFKFIESLLLDKEICIYGDGNQTRDFTYIDDVLDANLSVLNTLDQGEIFNIGGGCQISILEVINLLEQIIGKKANIRFTSTQKGDVRHTLADTQKARAQLNFNPHFDLQKGLVKEVKWVEEVLYEEDLA